MQALAGIKVVDFSRWLPGQYTGMVLGDYGADVIKVEAPEGDPNRSFAPLLADKMSSWNLALNRNKRGVTLNLRMEEGREFLKKLLAEADVFLEGFRPGYLAAKGLGWEDIRKINPRLVYCSMTGFGQDGKYRHQPAHDLNIIGLSGMNFLTDRQEPAISEVQVSAIGSGLNAVSAISMALFARERTGEGQHIDVNLYDTALGMQVVSIASVLGCRRTGDTPFGRRAHYYDVYPTKDGRHISVGTIEPKFWARFCRLAGMPELESRQYDFAAEEELSAIVRKKIGEKTLDQWMELLGSGDFCVTPVRTVDEALDSEMTAESGMLEIRQEDIGPVTYLKPAMKLSGTPGGIRFRAPYPGEHTDVVLRELGYTEERIAALREKGAI